MPHPLAHGHHVPLEYHRQMLEDVHRVDAFDRAIRALVRPGDVVLDVGTGTGILAMLAARAGASRVHAIEAASIGGLAADLIRRNGLADRITLHAGDALSIEPVEPVDLAMSEFMGRFVVDDGMLPAVEQAGRWLKPGGRFCPADVRLVLAPVAGLALRPVDLFRDPILGLDYGPALPYTWNYTYHGCLSPDALLAEGREYHRIRPPSPGEAPDRELSWTVERPGLLRAFAGWFDAELAPGVRLVTGPGVESHWGQLLFPVPPARVEAGTPIRIRLRLDTSVQDGIWKWEGEADGEPFQCESLQRLGGRGPARAANPSRGGARAAAASCAVALQSGKLLDAIQSGEEAAAALGPGEDDLARALHQDLGIAYALAGQRRPAMRALLRALDGAAPPGLPEDAARLADREPALRFLVTCAAEEGRTLDRDWFLGVYVRVFGPHPDLSQDQD